MLTIFSFQHCILTWIQQDSAKGQCPMCRQSKQPFENKGIYLLIQSRVRMETRRRMKKVEHYRFCIASAQEAWVGWGSFLSEIPLQRKQTLVLLCCNQVVM